MGAAGADAASGSDTRDLDWKVRGGIGLVTELPVGVITPTPDSAVRQHCTVMGAADADAGSGSDTRDLDWKVRVGIGPVAELPVGVGSPAPDSSVSE